MRTRLPIAIFTSMLSVIASAQSGPSPADMSNNSQGTTIIVNVRAVATPRSAAFHSGQTTLSNDFALAGLKAATAIVELQRQLVNAIHNGYPVAEFWIDVDRDRARDAVAIAALCASTDADRKALEQLTTQERNLRAWSDWLIEASRSLRLANYYMSPAALDNDAVFQQTVDCTRFLIQMLASETVTEDYSCR
jgi:hypothetical protein